MQILEGLEARVNPDEALAKLENSVNQIHQQMLQGLTETYRKWLKIALRWLICGDGEISATLIADEIEQTYFRPHRLNRTPRKQLQGFEQSDESSSTSESGESTKIGPEIRQSIKELVDETSDVLQISGDKIELAQETSVREWIREESEEIQKQAKRKQDCKTCWDNARDRSPYQAGQKHGHLLLARHIMRTLNSPSFQREHIFRLGIDDDELCSANDDETREKGGDPCAGAKACKDRSTTGEPHDDSDGESSHPAANAYEVNCGSEHDHSSESDRRSVAESFIHDNSDTATVTSFDGSKSADEDSNLSENETKSDNLRYELTNWHFYIRKAELEWPEEEREKGYYAETWSELYSEVDKFMDNKSPAFRVWQKRLWPTQPYKKFDSRLHYAAAYGLVGVMKRFIKDKDNPLETNEYGQTPLHLSCLGWADYTGLDFILEKTVEKGNETHVDALNSQTHPQTPVMLLIRYGAPVEHVKRLVKNGSRLNLQRENRDSTLHDAVKSRSVEMYRYILKEYVLTQKPSRRRESTIAMTTESKVEFSGSTNLLDPSIQNNDGETPLHVLLK